MKFDKTRPVKIVMLGGGGTGGHIAPHLYRLLHTLDRPVRFIIADADTVEPKNLVRQNFIQADLGENKAQVLAERYSTAFGLETEYVPAYIEEDDRLKVLVEPSRFRMPYRMVSSREFIQGVQMRKQPGEIIELVILIGAVDNNRSRQLCQRVFAQARDLIYIDSGNGEHTGQVVCGVRSGGRTMYKPVGAVYPDVLEDTDKFPSELSCAEASVSAPQSIVANVMAAAAVVNYVYNILVLGMVDVRMVTFSTNTINLKPTINRARRKTA